MERLIYFNVLFLLFLFLFFIFSTFLGVVLYLNHSSIYVVLLVIIWEVFLFFIFIFYLFSWQGKLELGSIPIWKFVEFSK